jgi:hypothetical protein
MIKLLDFGHALQLGIDVNCQAYDILGATFMLNDLLTNGTKKEYVGYSFMNPSDDYFKKKYKPVNEDKVIQGIFDLAWTVKGENGSQAYVMDEMLQYIHDKHFIEQ